MRRLTTALVLAVLVLAACGGDDEDVIIDYEPRDSRVDLPNPEVVRSEVVYLGEAVGAPPPGAAVDVVETDDLQAFADAYLDGDVAPVEAAVAGTDLDGRVLVGGIVHTGCFAPRDAEVAVEDGVVALVPLDLPDEEGTVECVRAVVTVGLLAVDPTVLPTAPEGGVEGEVAGQELELLEVGTHDRAWTVPGPGVARDRTDLHALEARFGVQPFEAELVDAVDRGERVVVAAEVGGGCESPTDARLVHADDGIAIAVTVAETPEELVCDEAVTALVVISAPAEEVPPGTVVADIPADAPSGPGVVVSLDPVDVTTEPSAERVGEGRYAFVVLGCEPATAEVVVGDALDTFTVELQQDTEQRVECDALSPYEVVVDVDPTWVEGLRAVA